MAAAIAAGCGGDEEDAKDKCRAFAQRACEVAVSCGEYDKNEMDDCRKSFEDDARCDDAVRVSKSYDECMDALEEGACTYPDSCLKVILVEK